MRRTLLVIIHFYNDPMKGKVLHNNLDQSLLVLTKKQEYEYFPVWDLLLVGLVSGTEWCWGMVVELVGEREYRDV